MLLSISRPMLTLLLAITTSTSPSHLFQHSTESFERYPRVDRRPSEHIHPGSTDDGEKYVNTNTRPKPHCETLAATIWYWCGWLDEKPEVISRQRATQARSMEEKMLYSHSHKTFFQFFSVDWRNSVKPGLKSLRYFFAFSVLVAVIATFLPLVWVRKEIER